MNPGDLIRLPKWLGSAVIRLKDEYRPGIWQVVSEETGVQFLISDHLIPIDRLADADITLRDVPVSDEAQELLDSLTPFSSSRRIEVCPWDNCGCSGEAHD